MNNFIVSFLSNSHTPMFVQDHLGVTLPVWPVLPQAMLTEQVEPMPLNHLIGHAHRTLAMKCVPDNQIMISGGWHGRWSPELEQGVTLPDQVEGNRAEAVAVYPGLADVPVAKAAADRLELISIDHIPVIDRLPGADNMVVATGWSGHGWAIAPAVIQLLAKWAYTEKQPDLFRPFSYRRFGRLL